MEHRQLIDLLTGAMIEQREKIDSLTLDEPPEEEIQGLQYRRGDRVIDSVTGREVIILAGKRAVGTLQGSEGG